MKTKFNKSEIMKKAWYLFKTEKFPTLSEALKMSWSMAKNETITFNKVYADYYMQVLNFITSKINKRDVAEDLTQDIFVKISQNLHKYDSELSGIKTWVFTVANRMLIDYYRTDKSNRLAYVDSYVNEDGKESFQFEASKQHGIEEAELSEAINKAISKLNSKEQEIANLHFLKDLAYKDVAEMLNIPMGSVKGTISRIKAKLQESLQNEYEML